MNTYNNNQRLLTIPLDDILAYYGKSVVHKGYMYRSPFRDEKDPSMRLTVNRDGTWVVYDFGEGRGYGCLSFVKRLEGTTEDAKAFEVLRKIASGKGMSVIEEEVRERVRNIKPSGIEIVSVSDTINRRMLLDYFVNERGIERELLERYCKEVVYRAKANPTMKYFAVGFPNSVGGYALRSLGSRKSNYKWGLSCFSPSGELVAENVCTRSGDMFEGFTNFLSKIQFMRLKDPSVLSTGKDACILHSAANVGHSRAWVESHESVRTFFDNDEAGDRATDQVAEWCAAAGIEFKDGRGCYPAHNDINDALKAVLFPERQREVRQTLSK